MWQCSRAGNCDRSRGARLYGASVHRQRHLLRAPSGSPVFRRKDLLRLARAARGVCNTPAIPACPDRATGCYLPRRPHSHWTATPQLATSAAGELGFDHHHLLSFWLYPTLSGYEDQRELDLSFVRDALTRNKSSVPHPFAFFLVKGGRPRKLTTLKPFHPSWGRQRREGTVTKPALFCILHAAKAHRS
jgi:hypothetical protein